MAEPMRSSRQNVRLYIENAHLDPCNDRGQGMQVATAGAKAVEPSLDKRGSTAAERIENR